jgi:hypothetical protein
MRTILCIASCFLLLAVNATRHTETGRSEEPKDVKWPRIDQVAYVGSTKCAECHKSYYDGWKDTAHNKMIRKPIMDGPNRTVFADFTQKSVARNFEFQDVKWVIGHRWKQRFVGEMNGQEVVYPAQWSIKEKQWQPYEGKSDWWYPTHMDWKTRSNFKLCAGCHSTGSDHYNCTFSNLLRAERRKTAGKHASRPIMAVFRDYGKAARNREL